MFLDLNSSLFDLLCLSILHPIRMEPLLSRLLNLFYSLHRHDRFTHQITIVLHGTITTFLKFKSGINGEFFPASFTISFRPGDFARVAFFVEVAMALGAAESESFGVVADEHNAVSWVAGGGAEVAFLDTHFGT
ncbi:hypothetical protein ACHAXS_011428 [Conticribra weissflogii]